MKKLSTALLASLVENKRKEKNFTQAQLSELTGINRAQLSRIETEDYLPLLPQLETLANILDFDPCEVFVDSDHKKLPSPSPLRIAVAGTGYVGLSIATLLAQHNHATAVDIILKKADIINHRESPIQNDYIEKYLAEKRARLNRYIR